MRYKIPTVTCKLKQCKLQVLIMLFNASSVTATFCFLFLHIIVAQLGPVHVTLQHLILILLGNSHINTIVLVVKNVSGRLI